MGRVSFDSENKRTSGTDFPKLKLEQGARARINCVEEPVAEYVHTLRAPKIENGRALTHVVERKDGTKYEDFKMDFIGQPLCLGDAGTLDAVGSDPANCPACRAAKEGDMVEGAKRRFAMHIVRYNTKPGGFELALPYGVNIEVWSFTEKTFGKLVDYQTEWGRLSNHDLMLGPCTNAGFQQFDIAVAKDAAWQQGDDRKQATAIAYRENQCKDLTAFCGRRVEMHWLQNDLNDVRQRFAIANGTAAPAALGASLADAPSDASNAARAEAERQASEALSGGLDDLLSSALGGGSAPTPAPASSGTSMADLLAASTPAPAAPAPVVHAAPGEAFAAAAAPEVAQVGNVLDALAASSEGNPFTAPPAAPAPAPAAAAEPVKETNVVSFDDLLKETT